MDDSSFKLKNKFDDVLACVPAHLKQDDYRPFFHRSLEILLGISPQEWHDPRMYTLNLVEPHNSCWGICVALNKDEIKTFKEVIMEKYKTPQKFVTRLENIRKSPDEARWGKITYLTASQGYKISAQTAFTLSYALDRDDRVSFLRDIYNGTHPEQVKRTEYEGIGKIDNNKESVDRAIEILFTGDERNSIIEKVNQARLRTRSSWQSVPRLSLGAIKLPTPGQRDIRTDEFVMNAAPLLIEQLSAYGIMGEEDAEKVVAQRLSNYFVHQGGFQLNRERAREIVGSLRGKRERVAI